MVHDKFLDNKPELGSADGLFVRRSSVMSCHVQYRARIGVADGCLFLKQGQHDAEECKRQPRLMSMCESSWAVSGG